MDIQTASRQDHQHAQQPAGGRGGAGSKRRGGERSEPPRSGEPAPPRATTNPNRQDTTTMTPAIAPCPTPRQDRTSEDRPAPEVVPQPTTRQACSPHERPDPEVVQCPKRRKFSAEYKRRILEELDACDKPGQIGALMRREGLYSSTLTQWRRQRAQTGVEGLAPKKRGPKSTRDPQAEAIQRLERENARLRKGLEQSRLIIDIQKKTAALLGMEIDEIQTPPNSENGDDTP